MHKLIGRGLEEAGPRESCSENEKKLARMLAKEWEPICDRVDLESFVCSPTAFLGFLQVIVMLYILAVPFYWFFPPVTIVLMLAAIVIFVLQFVKYYEFLDPLYPKRQGANVVGIIRPKGDVRKRVIFCGHIDSAYEFNIWLFFKNAAIPLMIVTLLSFAYLLGISIARTGAYFNQNFDESIYVILGIVSIAMYPLVGLFLFFHTYAPVPGAMDDLAGVAVAGGLGKYLAENKSGEGFFPEHTEVQLIGMACEEAGLRGAKRFVQKHLKEMKDIPTHAIFFDGVYDEKFLTVIHREICTGAKHDPGLVKMAKEVAAEHNWPMVRTVIPLGASDASVFSLNGISAVTMCCQDTSKLVPNYHTRHDTLEKVRPESLGVTLQIGIDMLKRIDKA